MTNAVRSNEEMAEDLFNRTFGRSMRAYRLVLSLLQCLRFGAPAARERFVDSLRQTAEAVLTREDFGTSEERAAALERMPQQVQGAASNTIKDALATADASCIVLMHTMVDGAVQDYCQVSALLKPTDWLAAVKGQKLTLAEALDQPQEKSMRDQIGRYLTNLARESLMEKIDNLQKACQPGRVEILKNYSYDVDRIRRIDRQRHDIVHDTFGSQFENVSDDLEYERLRKQLQFVVEHGTRTSRFTIQFCISH